MYHAAEVNRRQEARPGPAAAVEAAAGARAGVARRPVDGEESRAGRGRADDLRGGAHGVTWRETWVLQGEGQGQGKRQRARGGEA